MSLLIRLVLILSLALTGSALASARGQVMTGDRVVLCSGQAIVVTYGPDGRPSDRPAYCPDMALALLSAAAAPPITPVVVPRAIALRFDPAPAVSLGRRLGRAQARDPPVLSL